MANPYQLQQLTSAQAQAQIANQITERSADIAAFLSRALAASAATHHVEIEAVEIGHAARDMVIKTALGPVWARFGFVREQGHLYGVLELLRVKRGVGASIELHPLHSMVFDRNGNASFDGSAAMGWDWDDQGGIIPEAEAARTFARVLTMKMLEALGAP